MLAAGWMHLAGLAKVEAAKRDGSWMAPDAVENLETPDDLAASLAMYSNAAGHFDAFPRSVKRGILEWIGSVKQAATRLKRIRETAQLADENVRANQWPKCATVFGRDVAESEEHTALLSHALGGLDTLRLAAGFEEQSEGPLDASTTAGFSRIRC